MITDQFAKIKEAIQKIKEESAYQGWHEIADNIQKEVDKLEELIK